MQEHSCHGRGRSARGTCVIKKLKPRFKSDDGSDTQEYANDVVEGYLLEDNDELVLSSDHAIITH